jgi:hypothetical protein
LLAPWHLEARMPRDRRADGRCQVFEFGAASQHSLSPVYDRGQLQQVGAASEVHDPVRESSRGAGLHVWRRPRWTTIFECLAG